jgi:sugar O-acyltransferase (sialic acid O-acetyltransferase NeuD family)
MDRDLIPARLDGRRCWLEPFGERHLRDRDYIGWLHDYDVIRTLNLPSYWTPVPLEEIEIYCRTLIASPTDAFFALHDGSDGRFVGTVRAGHIDGAAATADIGIMIGRRDRWGRGLAQDAIATLCRWLFAECGMRRLTAGAMAINPAMIRVFEALGFRREGVMRQQDRLREGGYCDHIHLGCFRAEFEAAERPLVVLGAGGHARVVADAIRASGRRVERLLDREAQGDVAALVGRFDFVPAIGAQAARRRASLDALQNGATLASVIHPRAAVSAEAAIGAGAVVLAGAVVNPGVEIGRFAIVNTAASVDHDCRLADGAQLGPGARLAGDVRLGEDACVWTGAIVIPGCRIGARAVVGAGAVVIEDVPEGATVVGNPARIVVAGAKEQRT